MKKLFCAILALLALCGCAAAETVYVTISDGQGQIVMANEALNVADADDDGAITIFDALIAAHDAAYEGGAQAGFAAIDQGYGLSISRLWGEENGSSYGYYVNNAFVYSLTDPLAEGDSLRAYVFTDLETWSDTFCYFDSSVIETGEAFDLTLTAQTYDADWNPVYVPVEGAVITVNGEDTEMRTDAEGKVSIALEAGDYVISARSDAMNLVPPVCTAKIG